LDALHRATRTIPVAFVVVVDPVGAGLRPESGATGLQEIAFGLKRVGIVSDPAFRGFAALLRAIVRMAPSFGLEATTLVFHQPVDDIEAAVAEFAREAGSADRAANRRQQYLSQTTFLFSWPLSSDGNLSISSLCGRGRLDVLRVRLQRALPQRCFLCKSHPQRRESSQASGAGANQIRVVINLKTAKALGLTIPEMMQAHGAEDIEQGRCYTSVSGQRR
jgi:hypothetical protein